MIELAPAAERDGKAYCPRCLESAGEFVIDPLPLEHDENTSTTPRTLPVPSDHIQDMGRVFDGAVPVYAVVCERHDLACLHANGSRSGWVMVRLQTDNGLARAWVPEVEISSRSPEPIEDADEPPRPDGYGHIVQLGSHNYRACAECDDDAAILARAPPDPDAVDHPHGVFLCGACADG